ncbi:hypothetical protein CDO87_05670 [Sagittula sp. P11]|uniref:hypothetical protein n=1 Tax=Sagittula sp. P11 TaxID=2009329 RepID=UPI000C2D03A2|nr:hypothetical protein [Sagittula sp. P11]AUC52711.1 hypothetical protein CDO87_05670 [Sagittula sp. P11]
MGAAEQTGRHYHTPRAWVLAGGIAVGLTTVSGIAYLATEAAFTCDIRDAALILLVTLNAWIVYATGWLLTPRLGQMYANMPLPAHDPQRWIDRTLFTPASLVLAAAWGGLLAGGIWIYDPWNREVLSLSELVPLIAEAAENPLGTVLGAPDHCPNPVPKLLLTRMLSLFIFCGNLIIGAAVAVIFRFWWAVLVRIDDIDLRILNLSREPLPALLRANSLLVTTSALVASLSILSLILSGFEVDQTVALFSLLTLSLVVATYAVPILPLSNRLREVKSEAMNEVERLIEAHHRQRSGLPPRPDGPLKDPEGDGYLDIAKLEPLDKLMETRDTLHGIQTLPPGGQVSVSAAGIVAFLSFLPTIIDFLLK